MTDELVTEPAAGEPAAGEPAAPPRVSGWAVWPLRIVVLATTLLVFLQSVTAGLFVTGDVGMVDLHAAGHAALLGVVFIQIVVAILVWRPGRGPAWPIWVSAALLVAIEAQAATGFVRALGLHFPGGVLLFGITVGTLVGTWSRRMRVTRSTPRRARQ